MRDQTMKTMRLPLPPSWHEKLRQEASERGLTMTAYVRLIIAGRLRASEHAVSADRRTGSES